MIKLLRDFTLVCSIAMAIIIAILGYLYRQALEHNLIELEKKKNAAFTQMFSNTAWINFAPYIGEWQKLTYDELREHMDIMELVRDIRESTKGLNIMQTNIYAKNGNTVSSTEPQRIGVSRKGNESFDNALKGVTTTQLIFQDVIYTMDGIQFDRHVFISAMPLFKGNTQQVEAVLEIYSDVSQSMAEIGWAQLKCYLVLFASFSLVFLVSFVVVKRADWQALNNEKKIVQQQNVIEYQAYYDPLTGLPNRILYRDRLLHAMQLVERRETLLAALTIDLDRFKFINDTLGHNVGDQLIIQISKRLKNCLRSCDTIARFGSDEFGIVLEAMLNIVEIESIIDKILESATDPLIVDGHELFISYSVGGMIYPFGDEEVDDIINKATTAMYQAKDEGRNTYRFYCSSRSAQTASRFSLENALRKALDRNEFEIYYQPLVQLKTGRLISLECLLRWHSPDLGMVAPIKFIPILEDTGLINSVGQWVLETACCQRVLWQQQGVPDFQINVNISVKQFAQNGIINQVANAIEKSNMSPHLLDIEITESVLINDTGNIITELEILNEMGVSLSVDDFGTGYSSLSYLKRIPIDTLKIDRSFVNDITVDVNDAAIVDAICALARSLRLNVIAEGVETTDQLAYLQKLGVGAVQGYLFSKPLPASQIVLLFEKENWLETVGVETVS